MKKIFLEILLILLINTSCCVNAEPEISFNNSSTINRIEKKYNDYTETNNIIPVLNNETTIVINKIQVDTKLKKANVKNATGDFSDLEEYPLWISSTPLFGNRGLSVIIGHRQWGDIPKVFANLDKLEVGDIIVVDNFEYFVQYAMVVKPEEIYATYDILNKQFYENSINGLMLITCTPYGTSLKRLLIIAEQEIN